jgi:hypothetical protein
LQGAARQVDEGALSLLGSDLDKIYGGILVEAQHGVVNEPHRCPASRTGVNRIVLA